MTARRSLRKYAAASMAAAGLATFVTAADAGGESSSAFAGRRRHRPVELAPAEHGRAPLHVGGTDGRFLQTSGGDPLAQELDFGVEGGGTSSTESSTPTGPQNTDDGSEPTEGFPMDVGEMNSDASGGGGPQDGDPIPIDFNPEDVTMNSDGGGGGGDYQGGSAGGGPSFPQDREKDVVRPWGAGCPSSVTTAFDDSNGSYGNVFHVRTPKNEFYFDGQKDVWITGLDFYTDLKKEVSYEVWTKAGVYYADYTGSGELPLGDLSKWTLIANGTTVGVGRGRGTPIPEDDFAPVKVPAGGRATSIYVTLTTPDIRYAEGGGLNLLADDPDTGGVPEDTPFAAADDLIVYEGVGVLTYPFAPNAYQYSSPRLFLGSLRYEVEGTCAPTSAPTTDPDSPTLYPTPLPTTLPPVMPVTPSPTSAPTSAPVKLDLLTTRVLYTFFVTHDAAVDEAFWSEIGVAVKNALTGLMEEDWTELFDRAVDDGMVLVGTEAFMTEDEEHKEKEPECNPADPVAETCSTVAVTVTAEHLPSASRDDARHALYLYGPDVAASLGLPAVYTGIEAMTSSMIISLEGFTIDVPEVGDDGGLGFRLLEGEYDGNSLEFETDNNDASSQSQPFDTNTYDDGYMDDGASTSTSASGTTEGLMGDTETNTFETVLKKFLQERLEALGVDVTTTKVAGQQWVLATGNGTESEQDEGDYSFEEGDGIVIPDGGNAEDGYGSDGNGDGSQGGLFFEEDPSTGLEPREGAASAQVAFDEGGATRALRKRGKGQGQGQQMRHDPRHQRNLHRHRRLPKSSAVLEVTTTITGEHRPPPKRDLDELVEDSIDREPDVFLDDLKGSSKSDFFDGAKSVKTRQADGGSKKSDTIAPTPAPGLKVLSESGGNDQAKIIAIAGAVAGVVVLCIVAGCVYFKFYRKRSRSEEELDITELMAKQAKQGGTDKGAYNPHNSMTSLDSQEMGQYQQDSLSPAVYGAKTPPAQAFQRGGGRANCEASIGSVPTVRASNVAGARGGAIGYNDNDAGYGDEEHDEYQDEHSDPTDEDMGGGNGGRRAKRGSSFFRRALPSGTGKGRSTSAPTEELQEGIDEFHEYHQEVEDDMGAERRASDPYEERLQQRRYEGEEALHYRHLDPPMRF